VNKAIAIAISLGIMIAVYLIMMIVVPLLSDFASTANTTMSASSNMSNYPGTLEFLLSMPWILWFVPAALTVVAVIFILRQP
jgi:hypothetical protein